MHPAALLILAAAPLFDSFDEPLDSSRWFVGVGTPPRKGALEIPRGGWIVSRGLDDARVQRVEIDFRHKGGRLAIRFPAAREPLSVTDSPPALVVKKARGTRSLVLTREGATLDGEPVACNAFGGTFRIEALGGGVLLDEVRVAPRREPPRPPTALERRTVHFLTTPRFHRVGDLLYERKSMPLWDVEVAFLFRRGRSECVALRADVKAAPVLALMVGGGDCGRLAIEAGSSPLAMGDWGDERRNLSKASYLEYLQSEYALFEMLEQAQRALNAALSGRDQKDLDALVSLAVIRHSDNAHAAVALAETRKAKGALEALRKALGKKADFGRASPDALRGAAAQAAMEILGGAPSEWPGFRADPQSRFVTLQQARELVR